MSCLLLLPRLPRYAVRPPCSCGFVLSGSEDILNFRTRESMRIRSSMDCLPFASSRIRLLTINAAFHYAVDFRATLGEFKRVLPPAE